MIQKKEELEDWYKHNGDPWNYQNNSDDLKRKQFLLEEIPPIHFNNTLDIGCGNGFITQHLPGNKIFGIDLSENAIKAAVSSNRDPRISYQSMSIFELFNHPYKYDLIVITGVLYPQYIGNSDKLISILIDNILEEDGFLISVHITDWYATRFPYTLLSKKIYPYQAYLHQLEVYQK